MVSITEPVKITGIIQDRTPAWTKGLTASFNPRLYFMLVRNPQTGIGQMFPAEAFTFEAANPSDKPHVLRIIEAQREWGYDELAYPDWLLQEALMFPNKAPRKV